MTELSTKSALRSNARMSVKIRIACRAVLPIASLPLTAANWPSYRRPNNDGILRDARFKTTGEKDPAILAGRTIRFRNLRAGISSAPCQHTRYVPASLHVSIGFAPDCMSRGRLLLSWSVCRGTPPGAHPIDAVSLLPILKNTADGSRTGFSQMFGGTLTTSESGRAITDAAGNTLIQFDGGREEFLNTATDANQATNLLGAAINSTTQAAYAALKLKVANYAVNGVPNAPLVSSWFTANTGEYARRSRNKMREQA